MEMQFKPMPQANTADIRSTISQLQAVAAVKHPDLLAKLNEISGMIKTYDLLGDKAILEMVITELGKILQEQLVGSISVAAAPGRKVPQSWGTCIGDFVEYLQTERGLSPSSVRIYRAAVKKLLGYQETARIDPHALLEKAYGILRELIGHDDPERKHQNRNNISALRVFIDFLQECLRQIR